MHREALPNVAAKEPRQKQTAAAREHRHKGVLLDTGREGTRPRATQQPVHLLGKGQSRDATAVQDRAQVRGAMDSVSAQETNMSVSQNTSVEEEAQKCTREEESQTPRRANPRDEALSLV